MSYKNALKLITIATTDVAIILFIRTENMGQTMTMYDTWAVWHIAKN